MRDTMRLAAAGLALLLLAGAARGAPDPRVERTIRRQDELFAKGERTTALNEAKAAVTESDTAENRYLLGRAFGLDGQLEQAGEQFDRAVERDPACAYAYAGIGILKMITGQADEAEEQLNHALRLDPKLTRARVQLGKLFAARGDRAAAKKELEKVLEAEPGNLEVRILLGHLLLQTKHYDRAMQEFVVVITKEPDHPAARKGYALSLYFSRRTEEAVGEFKKYIALEPKDLEAYLFLKDAQVRSDDIDGAIETLGKLKENAPPESTLFREADLEIERLKAGVTGKQRVTLPELLEKLDSDDPEVRVEAMRFLVGLEISPPPKRMVRAVKDGDVRMRVLAVMNLGRVGGPFAVGVMEALLASPYDKDADERVRAAAAGGLMDLNAPSGIPVLLAALDDESFYVYRLAIGALRKLSGRSFVEDVSVPVEESQREALTAAWRRWWEGPRAFSLKVDAAKGIGELGFSRMAVYLVPLVGDADRPVAEAARDAFQDVTRKTIGTVEDLASPEGRARLKGEAKKIVEELQAKRAARRGLDRPPVKKD
jgi:tetratricopeptide (TPR) repeat protein